MCYTVWRERAGAVEGQLAHPARQSPRVWLAKAEGPDWVSSDSQQDLTSGMLKVNSSALESGEGKRTPGGRVVEPWNTELSLVGGTKVLARAISLSHPPAEIPKRTSSHHQTCLCHANTQCCASMDPSLRWTCLPLDAVGPLLQGTTDGKAS